MIKTITINTDTHCVVPKGMVYELPGLPMPISKGKFSKDLFDGFQMHQYAMRCLDDAIAAAPQPEQVDVGSVGWKHDCAALCANDIELWIDRCPHCGKPRHNRPPTDDEYMPECVTALYTTPQPDRVAELEQLRQRVTEKDEVIAEAGEMLAMRDRQLAAIKADSATAWAQAHRLALELECLLLDTKDNAIVSKWWDSGMEALSEYQELKPGAAESAEAWAKMRKAGL